MGDNVFRHAPAQTRYPDNRTAFKADFALSAIYASFATLLVVWVVLLPSYRMTRKMVVRQCLCFASLLVLFYLFVANYSYDWQVDEVHTRVLYKPYSTEEIIATVGIKVGLRGVNVTLLGLPRVQHLFGSNETIDYNEQFSWSEAAGEVTAWSQGRFGFGVYSNPLNQEFRAGQLIGQPWAIQFVAEWLTVDGESIRWGRWYRVAGYYAHILLWAAVPTWLVCVVTLSVKPFIGGLWTLVLGLEIVLAAGLWMSITSKAQPRLKVAFENGVLEPKYGYIFYHTWILGTTLLLAGPAISLAALRGYIPWDTRIMSSDQEPFDFDGRTQTAARLTSLWSVRMATRRESVTDRPFLYGRKSTRTMCEPDAMLSSPMGNRQPSKDFARIEALLLPGEIAQSEVSDLPEGLPFDDNAVYTRDRARISYALGARRPSELKLEIEAAATRELDQEAGVV